YKSILQFRDIVVASSCLNLYHTACLKCIKMVRSLVMSILLFNDACATIMRSKGSHVQERLLACVMI
ncbi:MAG: hypothetical protein HVK32_03180, partial [Pelagibacteraceae bacterium]|nr:hypothetical protein [Pelagibacteraceae bacterium]